MDSLYGLQFHDQAFIDKEIDALVTKQPFPVADRDRVLGFIRNAASFQLDSTGSGIHAFVQAWTKLSVYDDAKTDDFIHQ